MLPKIICECETVKTFRIAIGHILCVICPQNINPAIEQFQQALVADPHTKAAVIIPA